MITLSKIKTKPLIIQKTYHNKNLIKELELLISDEI